MCCTVQDELCTSLILGGKSMINYNSDICFKANTKTLDHIINIQNINANSLKKKKKSVKFSGQK